MVAELRAKTDAPMMECKKALTEAEGDMERAEELLRVKLGSKAGKAASRVTAEGVVSAFVDGTSGALVEVNCETDFVSKNDSFLAFTKACAELVAKSNPADVAALSALAYEQDGFGPTLEDGQFRILGTDTALEPVVMKGAQEAFSHEGLLVRATGRLVERTSA
jgi:elongation factor Ts